ncbi:cytochrome c-type biogenesis protein [Candidatus Planktophila sulfonica]|uniref:Cytochrome c-type biogenesis protein n=1 Tax=Candidatus Planktophila sulfonica TaxID=1884904 RepID=A0A249KIB7_9ACTN|nr:cytochrome c biogenesis protein CcdA [Candidatus Planktophila sulfonica]ASY16429.1 cytochrome c-type biogenesis protein [Candidatus Planktophila sulfonica]
MTDFVVNTLMDGFLLSAFPIAILAGLISFISPCVLPLVPGYVAFAAGFSKSRGRIFLGSLLFVFGFSILFISYGALFGQLGAEISSNEEMITRVLGLLTIVMGVIFLGAFPLMPTLKPKISTQGGLIGAPLLGFLFGVGWTPCIGPALASVQALAFQESSAVRGAILSLGYCIGLGLPFIASGLFLDKSEKLRKVLVKSGGKISTIGGVLLIIIGILQLTGLWTDLMIEMRSLISEFAPVI